MRLAQRGSRLAEADPERWAAELEAVRSHNYWFSHSEGLSRWFEELYRFLIENGLEPRHRSLFVDSDSVRAGVTGLKRSGWRLMGPRLVVGAPGHRLAEATGQSGLLLLRFEPPPHHSQHLKVWPPLTAIAWAPLCLMNSTLSRTWS